MAKGLAGPPTRCRWPSVMLGCRRLWSWLFRVRSAPQATRWALAITQGPPIPLGRKEGVGQGCLECTEIPTLLVTETHQIGGATAAIWHQRHKEQHAMKTRRKRTVGRAVGAGLVAGGLALGVAACAGSPAQHETDNAHLEDGAGINTQRVNTVGQTFVNTTSGNTVSG